MSRGAYESIHLRLHSAYSVTFSQPLLTETNYLKPPEIRAAFLFCNILAARSSS
jgi:hypothetical protein